MTHSVDPLVETVDGPVRSSDLGLTLPHEHILYALLGWDLDYGPRLSFEARVEACLQALWPAVEGGVRTIVDLTTAETGRDVTLLSEVARRASVKIVCSTGLYARRQAPYFSRRTVAELEAFMLREATEGIAGTGIKAGVVKCAVDGPELNEHETAVLTAGAHVALEVGLPLMVHVEPGAARAVMSLVKRLSVPGSQLVIAHGESADVDGLLDIVDGHDAYVGFDRFGFELTLPDEERVAKVAELCRRGYAQRILLSHDTIGLFLGRARDWTAGRAELKNWTFGYLTTRVLPWLAESGVSHAQLRQMTIENPARVLAPAL